MEEKEIIDEFLIESAENLARLDREMVELEKRPKDGALLASVFRTIHTIKGTCGFLGFGTLEKITHLGENILSQVRNLERDLNPPLVSLILEMVDAIKAELTAIEQTGSESGAAYTALQQRLSVAWKGNPGEGAAPEKARTGETPAPETSAKETPEQEIRKAVVEEAEPGAVAEARPAAGTGQAAWAMAEADETEGSGGLSMNLGSTGGANRKGTASTLGYATGVGEEAAGTGPRQTDAERPGSAAGAGAGSGVGTGSGAGEGDSGTAVRSSVTDSTIRVDVNLLDKLMNLVGELVLARNQILQYSNKLEDAAFNATSQRLNLITTQLQEGVMKTRMQPIGVVWNKLPRVVRDLAASCQKQIHLEMDGSETELDKSIIEAIKDPLTHIVRNCCDHGFEMPEVRVKNGKPATGRLHLRAFHEGGQVNIEVHDDGSGINPDRIKAKAVEKGLLRPEQAERLSEREAIQLIFMPGFSTAEKVTNISGRGVGMDVVKTNIEKIGGTVDIASRTGFGTTVKIKIPLTLAIIPGLVVMSGGQRFVIPQVSLLELVRLEGESGRRLIESIHGTPVYRRRGNLLPIAYLNDVLKLGVRRASDVLNIVILQAEDRQFGLVVDDIHDTQEIVVKPLGKQLKGLSCYAGATIMGDGKVALILDVLGIGLRSKVLSESRASAVADRQSVSQTVCERQTLLLFRSGPFERLAVPLSLVARLEEFPRNRIERAAGKSVVQYRGQILPLLALNSYLDPCAGESVQDPAQVVVFSDGDRRVGILVDQILDIVDDEVVARQATQREGLLGSAVVGQKVTDFLDLHRVIQSIDSAWFDIRKSVSSPATILVAESSTFVRGLLRHYLEMAGHRVLEAGNVHEAWERMNRARVDVAAVAIDLAGGGSQALLDKVRGQTASERTRLIGLASGDERLSEQSALRQGFDDLQSKFDRDAMLASVSRLAVALRGAQEKEPLAGLRR